MRFSHNSQPTACFAAALATLLQPYATHFLVHRFCLRIPSPESSLVHKCTLDRNRHIKQHAATVSVQYMADVWLQHNDFIRPA